MLCFWIFLDIQFSKNLPFTSNLSPLFSEYVLLIPWNLLNVMGRHDLWPGRSVLVSVSCAFEKNVNFAVPWKGLQVTSFPSSSLPRENELTVVCILPETSYANMGSKLYSYLKPSRIMLCKRFLFPPITIAQRSILVDSFQQLYRVPRGGYTTIYLTWLLFMDI